MVDRNLSPLAAASRDLVVGLATGADPAEIEAGCRELFLRNTNGGSVDSRVADVASQIVRGVLAGAVMLRSDAISAATRGVSQNGPEGDVGDADRLRISEGACRYVRDSAEASDSDYQSALAGAAFAARMTADQLGVRLCIELAECADAAGRNKVKRAGRSWPDVELN